MRLPRVRRCFFIRGSVYHVVLVRDSQDLLAIEPDLNKSLISLWKPKVPDLLVLTHKVGALDPEGELLLGTALNPHYGVISGINPYLAFKQILVLPLGHGLRNETAVRSNLLFTEQLQGIVRGRDGAVAVLFAGCSLNLAGNQPAQRHAADDPRSFFRDCHKILLVGSAELHAADFFRVHFSL